MRWVNSRRCLRSQTFARVPELQEEVDMADILIGQSLARVDAVGKVTGAALYPGDLTMPGMLHMKVLFARRPHARIRRLDTSRAEGRAGRRGRVDGEGCAGQRVWPDRERCARRCRGRHRALDRR